MAQASHRRLATNDLSIDPLVRFIIVNAQFVALLMISDSYFPTIDLPRTCMLTPKYLATRISSIVSSSTFHEPWFLEFVRMYVLDVESVIFMSLQNCDTTLNSEFIPCLGVLDSSNRSSAKNKAVRIVPPYSTPNFVLSSATPNEAMNK